MTSTTLVKRFMLAAILALALSSAFGATRAAHADEQLPARGLFPGVVLPESLTPRLLGGLNLDVFCRDHGALGSAVRYNKWVCYAETNFDVDFQDACQWAYNAPLNGRVPDVRAFPVAEANNPLAINCFTTSSHALGGLNLKAYCQAFGATHVAVIANQWTCYSPAALTLGQPLSFVIDMDNACRWSYGFPAFAASPRGNHIIVNCFR